MPTTIDLAKSPWPGAPSPPSGPAVDALSNAFQIYMCILIDSHGSRPLSSTVQVGIMTGQNKALLSVWPQKGH